MHGPWKLGMRVRQFVLATRKQQHLQNAGFVKTVLQKLVPYVFISHTDAHAVRETPH